MGNNNNDLYSHVFVVIFVLLSISAQSTLMFSEYVGGSGYNEALEIFNIGDTIDFDSDSYAIEIYIMDQ